MIYKKFLAVLVIVLATVLVGCDTAEPAEDDTSAEVQETEEMDEEMDDMEATEEADG